MHNRTLKGLLTGMTLAAYAMVPVVAEARPGTLAQSPLFLSSQVKSNLFFVLDDSGSMDWEVLQSNGALAAHGGYPNSGNLDYTPNNDAEVLELCVGYNVLAYDPGTIYTPWIGEDDSGNTYTDLTLTTARPNPFFNGTTNLSNTFYFVWNDADGDGDYDVGECPRPDPAAYGGGIDAAECRTIAGCVVAADLPAAQQSNYANWYSYYRKREYVMKRAVSELINDATNRVGMATLWNNSLDGSGVSTPVQDMEVGTNRADLMERLFNVDSSGGTPLRNALEEAGEYFHMDDGQSHQYFSSASSPILSAAQGGACQQNFTVVMSDGYWNSTASSKGNEDHDTQGANDSIWDGGAMADNWSNTLADVAMYYYENDLSSTLADQVRTTAADLNTAQHLVTFTVAFGVNGTLASDPPDRTTPFAWPDPLDTEDEERIDDMRHAAFNARGQFLSAKNPQQLISSLSAAIAEINARTGSASSVSFNTSRLTANSVVYQAHFNSTRWSGELEAYDLDPITGDVAVTPNWQASTVLDGQASRVMLTHNGTDGVPFTWAQVYGTPIASALADLRSDNAGGTVTDAEAQARLDYLRGDRSNEGAGYQFRQRDSRLGDIVHSTPIFVGAPALRWPDAAPFPTASGSRYSDFKHGSAASRQEVVYVGSNDGTLHGFRADTGEEVLAYVPSMLFSSATNEGLHYLTDPNYLHRYYVDLEPTLSDAYVRITPAGSPAWRTVLIGALRGGGRGLFALDVTNPLNFSEATTNAANTVLWEFSSSDDLDLGHTFSQPRIAMMNNGEWAVILGNGYNDLGSGEAKLFILFLEDGLDGWSSGDYIELTTGVGNPSDRNGLSSPTLADLDGNGTVDRVYAGDLHGNMWAFDLSSSNPSTWRSAYRTGSTPRPLFTAPNTQPITARPRLAKHPTELDVPSNQPNVMVYFGTGQYLTDADKSNADVQTFYGVWDDGTGQLTQSDLVQQGFNASFANNAVITTNPVDYAGSDKGWYIDMPESGERIVATPIIRDGIVYFVTLIPDADPCAFGSRSFLMALDMATGGNPSFAAFDTNYDGVLDASDYVSGGGVTSPVGRMELPVGGGAADPKTLGDNIYIPDPSGPNTAGGGGGSGGGSGLTRIKIPPVGGDRTGRLSWQELIQD
ncbi:MAG: PilC/PilY family type IV pilus protein [Gammaproteobacteria bacterium]